MRDAVIVHGKPTRARYENPLEPKPYEANWLPWLGRQLCANGVEVSIPAMPRPYFPVYAAWKAAFEENHVGSETTLVGHSAGAEFILRWLSEDRKAAAEQVALVAPYKDYAGKYSEFSRYLLDADIASRVGSVVIFNSLDDDEPIQRRAHELASIIPDTELIELEGFGHFRIGHNMQSEEFPQLLEVLQR
jgi:predicted alpha/beta hydrolase family esterase